MIAPRTVTVVGAGLAGARTVAALRARGYDGRIHLVGADPLPPYDRPPLSKHLFDRPAPVWLREDLDIDVADLADDVRLATAAGSLSVCAGPPAARYRTELTDGTGLETDAVVIATGSVPRTVPGWAGVRTLHTPADAAVLRERLGDAGHLVCIGAGWIGAEVAGVAAAHGARVTVLEAGPAPLAGALGQVGALTVPWYRDVDLHTGVRVAAASEREVRLADGRTMTGDVVLAAIGARPATDWLGGSIAGQVPLRADGTIAVDAALRPLDAAGLPVPALAGVRAVGDVAMRRSVRHGNVPGGHWDAALRGPEAAVASLLGEDGTPPDPAPYVFSTQFGHELVLHGHPGARDNVVLRGDVDGAWTALWFVPGSGPRPLTAVLSVDRPRDVAAARRLFRAEHLPRLDPESAADETAPLRAVG
ncbi:MAG: NAD(P)/FAD-dependent oxidoreductase [Cellulomonadaceae bacterium]